MPRFHLSCAVLALCVAPFAAQADVPRVVTDTPVTASLVAAVMGDLGAPEALVSAGQDAHDVQLKPSQAGALQNAGLLVWVGPEMTGWLSASAEAMGPDRLLTLLKTPGAELRDYPGATTHDHGDDHDHDHDHDHSHDHSHEDHSHDHDHSHDGVDPHAWLNPRNASVWVTAIGEALAAKDAANAATYRANAAATAKAIDGLDAEIADRLTPLRGKRFVVAHDAYGYLTEHYQLEPALAVAAGNATTAGAARLGALRKSLADERIVCAFPEANHDPSALRTVIEGTSIRLGRPLDPEGSALSAGPGLYPALMAGLTDALTECLEAEH